MELTVQIRKKLSMFELDVSFVCPVKRLLAVIGPSGSGKTTIVRIIAGLDRPDSGLIKYGDQTWVDTQKGIFVPPQKRKLGYVFQEYTLFPHLNLYRNVSFASKDAGHVEYLMKTLDIWDLKDRKPCSVSGGERQRCAIAQALARNPQVLLLDEPFSALDVTNRRKLRKHVKAIKDEFSIPIVHVTHDIDEAMYLADEILPVIKGSIARKWLMQFLLKDRTDLINRYAGISSNQPDKAVHKEDRKVS